MSWSCAYMMSAMLICLRLLTQDAARAFSRAFAKTGNRMAARIAMIAMTTSSSIRVKPLRLIGFHSPCGFVPNVSRASRYCITTS